MHREWFLAIVVLLATSVAAAEAADVLTIGSGSGPSGGQVSIPVSIRDLGATPLGSDAGPGNRIQGIAFKVTFPTAVVASVSFARAGVTALATPLYETTLQGSGFSSFVVSFSESLSPIPFNLNAAAPGDQIGTLTVSLQPVANGSTAVLTFDPPAAILSNQAGTVRETVADGNLTLVNGSVSVNTDLLPAPSALAAGAIDLSHVDLDWLPVTDADHYEVWRSFHGEEFALAGTSSEALFEDTDVVAGTVYLYRVRAVGGSGSISGFSNLDPAITFFFQDDPLVANETILKALHVTELRTTVNAMSEAAKLSPLADDATVAVGAPVRAEHIADLRSALAAARSAVGLGAVMYTDAGPTPGVTRVKAVHVQELRDGMK